ncbi:MAG TPA: pyrroline-5-carboxylate reductase [Balneolaceae bacterium]|nr:pyrroline-5-carboxylate reductase [Balneolaceae bacterium]
MNLNKHRVAILGAGNLGCSIAEGLYASGTFSADSIYLTRRRIEKLDPYKEKGFQVTADNNQAVTRSSILLICVEPHQLDQLLEEIRETVDPAEQIVISVVSGAEVAEIKKKLPAGTPVVRAMPNTAISIRESMTCICSDEEDRAAAEIATSIFDTVGHTQIIHEEQMSSATALCACGIAFFLRAIRAASQGGIEIGFSSQEALKMATQTAKGAASLLSATNNHPEHEIDRVTTPKGCTISGLNRMEHGGFSSALIQGILHSAEKAGKLY